VRVIRNESGSEMLVLVGSLKGGQAIPRSHKKERGVDGCL